MHVLEKGTYVKYTTTFCFKGVDPIESYILTGQIETDYVSPEGRVVYAVYIPEIDAMTYLPEESITPVEEVNH